jgi:hypothetical protein
MILPRRAPYGGDVLLQHNNHLTVLALDNVDAQRPIVQGIGASIFGCVGFQDHVSRIPRLLLCLSAL